MTDTAKVTRGIGVLDPESDLGGKAARNDDNNNTLRKVIQSKGLAGVFDHHYLEEDSSRKSITAKEMEEHAKRAAWDAAKALEKSLEQSSRQRYEPTWTGSKETAAKNSGRLSKLLAIRVGQAIYHIPLENRNYPRKIFLHRCGKDKLQIISTMTRNATTQKKRRRYFAVLKISLEAIGLPPMKS